MEITKNRVFLMVDSVLSLLSISSLHSFSEENRSNSKKVKSKKQLNAKRNNTQHRMQHPFDVLKTTNV